MIPIVMIYRRRDYRAREYKNKSITATFLYHLSKIANTCYPVLMILIRSLPIRFPISSVRRLLVLYIFDIRYITPYLFGIITVSLPCMLSTSVLVVINSASWQCRNGFAVVGNFRDSPRRHLAEEGQEAATHKDFRNDCSTFARRKDSCKDLWAVLTAK